MIQSQNEKKKKFFEAAQRRVEEDKQKEIDATKLSKQRTEEHYRILAEFEKYARITPSHQWHSRVCAVVANTGFLAQGWCLPPRRRASVLIVCPFLFIEWPGGNGINRWRCRCGAMQLRPTATGVRKRKSRSIASQTLRPVAWRQRCAAPQSAWQQRMYPACIHARSPRPPLNDCLALPRRAAPFERNQRIRKGELLEAARKEREHEARQRGLAFARAHELKLQRIAVQLREKEARRMAGANETARKLELSEQHRVQKVVRPLIRGQASSCHVAPASCKLHEYPCRGAMTPGWQA